MERTHGSRSAVVIALAALAPACLAPGGAARAAEVPAEVPAAEAPAAPAPAAGERAAPAPARTLQAEVDRLRKFKFSGYVQARWETAENSSDSVQVSGSGPSLAPANRERFSIRRGRLKLTYDSGPRSQAVVYLDGASSGSSIDVRLLEAHVTLFDPWTRERRHAVTIGQMNVPFGYELERSSSSRELLERSRAENALFPGERDRGVKLASRWSSRLETVVGLFNGPGIASAEFPTADPGGDKDLVARARAFAGFADAAVSWYGGHAVVPLTGPDARVEKTRLGLDAQGRFRVPRLGKGSVAAEFYAGTELNPDSVRALVLNATSGAPRLLRAGADPGHLATDFAGGYAMLVQDLGAQAQVAVRYDRYDPDTGADHDRYERWSVAAHWFHDDFTRVTVEYDVPHTERPDGGRWTDPHDNAWTVQVQHRF